MKFEFIKLDIQTWNVVARAAVICHLVPVRKFSAREMFDCTYCKQLQRTNDESTDAHYQKIRIEILLRWMESLIPPFGLHFDRMSNVSKEWGHRAPFDKMVSIDRSFVLLLRWLIIIIIMPMFGNNLRPIGRKLNALLLIVTNCY